MTLAFSFLLSTHINFAEPDFSNFSQSSRSRVETTTFRLSIQKRVIVISDIKMRTDRTKVVCFSANRKRGFCSANGIDFVRACSPDARFHCCSSSD